MQYASFTFLFLFLPITMGIYYLVPQRFRRDVMLGISLLFLLCGGWMAAITEILLTAMTYGAGLLMERFRSHRICSGILLTEMCIVQFGALILLRSDWMQSLQYGIFKGSMLFPLGLSFFVLQSVGYCADIRRGKIFAERNWRQLGLYLLFYPRQIMGPVVSYRAALRTRQEPLFSAERIGGGLLRLLVGMGKKLILADNMEMLFQTVSQADPTAYSLLPAWLGAFAKLLALYLELSGYADMAIGIGMCYGVRLPESYGKSMFYPSLKAFADQFNRTVVQWFSHYFGSHFHAKNAPMQLLAIMLTWGCIGLWYGFRLPTLMFGLIMGACIWLEHLIRKGQGHSAFGYTLTVLLLSIGAMLLTQSDWNAIFTYGKIMFGGGHWVFTEADGALLRNYGFMLVLCIYGVSGNWRRILHLVEEKPWFRFARIPLTLIFGMILLFAVTAYLMQSGDAVQMQLRL